jgi:hypothetical protein
MDGMPMPNGDADLDIGGNIIRIVTMVLAMISTAMTSAMTRSSCYCHVATAID